MLSCLNLSCFDLIGAAGSVNEKRDVYRGSPTLVFLFIGTTAVIGGGAYILYTTSKCYNDYLQLVNCVLY